MNKNKTDNIILETGRRVSKFKDNRYTWGEIKDEMKRVGIVLKDSDIIELGYSEGWDEGDSARDPFYDLKITRKIQDA